MDSFIPPALRRQRNQRRLTLEAVSGATGMSPQHLSEIESGKRDPRLSSIERIAEAMGLSVMLVPEHMAPEGITCLPAPTFGAESQPTPTLRRGSQAERY